VREFKAGLRKVCSIQCDVLLSSHPDQLKLWERYDRSIAGEGLAAFRTRKSCAASLADVALDRLKAALKAEASANEN
jgi:hypothetical protein